MAEYFILSRILFTYYFCMLLFILQVSCYVITNYQKL